MNAQPAERKESPCVGNAAEQLAARKQRILDAEQLRQPDRVPTYMPFLNLLYQLEGVSNAELYNDPEKAHQAMENAARRFQPDMCESLFLTPGVSRALGDRMTRWPGYGLDDYGAYQYHEQEYMKADDYDAFLADPSDWAIRRYLPRIFEELGGLAMLPPMGLISKGALYFFGDAAVYAMPPIVKAAQALFKAGQEHLQWIQQMIALRKRLEAQGFLLGMYFEGSHCCAPFDHMADTLRGMRGIFTDMRRCPEKLLAAEEKVIPWLLESAATVLHVRHNPYSFIPLHRGSDGFISLANFDKFYWPQLKRVILALIEMGVTPVVLWEGVWDQRLQYLAELPKGKTIGIFQATDLVKAKQAIGDVMCIVGGMPNSLLVGGTPSEIREHTHKMCETVGKGGGFIFSTEVGDLQGCKPELIEVWAEATREFGKY
jgi:uroporphyrinogen-III decarboxylase